MDHAEIESFLSANAQLYAAASGEDVEQLAKISVLYPGSVRLLAEADAMLADGFKCQRCGACCSEVKYISVSRPDVLRWIAQERWDILDRLAVDRRRTPLMAIWGPEVIAAAKKKAAAALEGFPMDEERLRRATELLYVTDLVECAVNVARDWGHCAFFSGEDNACLIQDTKPRVCEKFPFYVGTYTDARLLNTSFCPGLKALAEKK